MSNLLTSSHVKCLLQIINDDLTAKNNYLNEKFPTLAINDSKTNDEAKKELFVLLTNQLNITSDKSIDDSTDSLTRSKPIYEADVSNLTDSLIRPHHPNDLHWQNNTERYFADDSRSILMASASEPSINNKDAEINDKETAHRHTETSSGVHSDISFSHDYDEGTDATSDASSEQYVIPVYGDTDTDSYCSDQIIRPTISFNSCKNNNKFYRIAFDTRSDNDTGSSLIDESYEFDRNPGSKDVRKSFSWLNKTRNSCSCSFCNGKNSNDCSGKCTHPNHSFSVDINGNHSHSRSFNPKSSANGNYQSTPIRSSGQSSNTSQLSELCESCIKKRTKILAKKVHTERW